LSPLILTQRPSSTLHLLSVGRLEEKCETQLEDDNDGYNPHLPPSHTPHKLPVLGGMLVTITVLSLSFGQALCTSYRVFSNLGVFPSFIIPPAQALLPFHYSYTRAILSFITPLTRTLLSFIFPYPGIMSSYYH
jgi:hypothetical protein